MAEEGGQDEVWWEPTCNVYEIISGPSSTATALACEGVRRWHIKSPCAQAAFLHKVEQAKDERAWLDADAGKVLSPRGIFLGPHIQGILSYSTGQPGRGGDFTGVPLRHYLLLSSADRRPCNSGFHDMRCTSDSTTAPRRKPQKEGNSPIRCDYCQRLYDVIRPHMNDMTRASLHARPDFVLRLRRLDQDCAENHFANVRRRGGNNGATTDTAKAAQQAANVNRFAKCGKSHTNTRGAEPDPMATSMVFDQREYMPSDADKMRESQHVFY